MSMKEIIEARKKALEAEKQKAEAKKVKSAEKKKKELRLKPDAPNVHFDDDPAHQPANMGDLKAIVDQINNSFTDLKHRIETLEAGIQNKKQISDFTDLELSMIELAMKSLYKSNTSRFKNKNSSGMMDDLELIKKVIEKILKKSI